MAVNYKQGCVSSLVESEEFFPMLVCTGKFCSTGLCLPLFFRLSPSQEAWIMVCSLIIRDTLQDSKRVIEAIEQLRN